MDGRGLGAGGEVVQMAWAGAGEGERVKRSWTVSGTTYSSTYAWSALGLSGYTSTGIGAPGSMSSVTSWIVRDSSGTPIAQRYSNGQEYYYLLDGQGDVVALEDPGTIQGAGDMCPTGNEAGLFGAPTTVWLANPLGQYQEVRDDDTKLHLGPLGFRAEASGVWRRAVAFGLGRPIIGFRTSNEPLDITSSYLAEIREWGPMRGPRPGFP